MLYYLFSTSHLVFHPLLPQALPRLGYDSRHLDLLLILPQALPRLRLNRPHPQTLFKTLAVFHHFLLPICMGGIPAASFYYLFSARHLVFQTHLPQALPRLGYNTRQLVFQPRLPLALAMLRLQRP
jgi:hypothetical protein